MRCGGIGGICVTAVARATVILGVNVHLNVVLALVGVGNYINVVAVLIVVVPGVTVLVNLCAGADISGEESKVCFELSLGISNRTEVYAVLVVVNVVQTLDIVLVICKVGNNEADVCIEYLLLGIGESGICVRCGGIGGICVTAVARATGLSAYNLNATEADVVASGAVGVEIGHDNLYRYYSIALENSRAFTYLKSVESSCCNCITVLVKTVERECVLAGCLGLGVGVERIYGNGNSYGLLRLKARSLHTLIYKTKL